MFNLLQAAEVAVEAEAQTSNFPLMEQIQPFVMIGFMLFIFWILLWRPEQKRRKEATKFRDALKKGDKVVTAGGIYATIKEVQDTTLLIEVDSNVTLRIDKSMVVADASSLQKQA